MEKMLFLTFYGLLCVRSVPTNVCGGCSPALDFPVVVSACSRLENFWSVVRSLVGSFPLSIQHFSKTKAAPLWVMLFVSY